MLKIMAFDIRITLESMQLYVSTYVDRYYVLWE